MTILPPWLIEKLEQEKQTREQEDRDSWVNQPKMEIVNYAPTHSRVAEPTEPRGCEEIDFTIL